MFAIQVLVSVDIQAEMPDRYEIKMISLFSDVLLQDLVIWIFFFLCISHSLLGCPRITGLTHILDEEQHFVSGLPASAFKADHYKL